MSPKRIVPRIEDPLRRAARIAKDEQQHDVDVQRNGLVADNHAAIRIPVIVVPMKYRRTDQKQHCREAGESARRIFHEPYPKAASIGPQAAIAAGGEMGCICVDHRGQNRTYEDPRRFMQWPAAFLGREQKGSEERALDEFLEDILGQPHESHTNAMALVDTANRQRWDVIVS